MFKKLFKYIEPIWLGKDDKMSLRSVGAMALIIDFIINVHNASYVLIKVLNLIMIDKNIDALVISSLAGYLAQMAMILGIEAGLIAALLALKTYQGNVEFLKTTTTTTISQPPGQQPTVPPGQPMEQVNPS